MLSSSKTQIKGPTVLGQVITTKKGRSRHTLMAKLQDQDQPSYRKYAKMTPDLFTELEQRFILELQRERFWF